MIETTIKSVMYDGGIFTEESDAPYYMKNTDLTIGRIYFVYGITEVTEEGKRPHILYAIKADNDKLTLKAACAFKICTEAKR